MMENKTYKSKYPWIPKEYYAAVMYACKLIRDNGNYNKSIRIASNYYDVDEDTLSKHVRARQAAGQKGKTRKYKYYVSLCFKPSFDLLFPDDFTRYAITDFDEYIDRFYFIGPLRCTNEENAMKKSKRVNLRLPYRDIPDWFRNIYDDVLEIHEFENKEDAQKFIDEYKLTTETLIKYSDKCLYTGEFESIEDEAC